MSSDSDVDNVVKQYLLRKGYKKAADALTAERGALSLRQVAATVANDAQVVQQIALHDSAQYTPERYAQSYALFAGWVLSSLDMYKVPFPPLVRSWKWRRRRESWLEVDHDVIAMCRVG